MDAATLDNIYKTIATSSGKPAPANAGIPALVFDSQKSEDRFLALIAREQTHPSPERRPGVSRWSFAAGEWVKTDG